MHTRSVNVPGAHLSVSKLHYWYLLVLVFLAGSFMRVYRITDQIVIDDEWHALNAVQNHDFSWIFTHFGTSDHSIPLALIYEIQYQITGLNEILLRWPMLLAGCLAVLVLPHLLRHWLNRPEQLLLAALLAISPLLIYYSRFARPYGLLTLLEPAALLMAWHWWKSNQTRHAVGWVLLATFSAWLNTPALIVVTAPFAWFGLLACRRAIFDGDRTTLARLAAIGGVMLVLLAVLLGPPLATQSDVIITKAGRHLINWETVPWAVSLASGSGHPWVFAAIGLLALTGSYVLFNRDKDFGRYMLFTCVLAVFVLVLTGAAFAQHGNVFLRYLIGLVPFFIACVAAGLVYASTRIVHYSWLPTVTTKAVLIVTPAVLFLTGPIPDWPLRNSQFLTHQNYHFHYNQDRNVYRLSMEGWFRKEPFYAEIAAQHEAGEASIVEAPWSMESYTNPINLQQDIHRQRVVIGFINGVCAGPLYGELTFGQPGMKFQNFVHLQELLDGTRTADYLVLRNRHTAEGIRKVEMDFDHCVEVVRERFGEPWRESQFATVFKIRQTP
jgi:hypothetical protein